MSTEPEKNLQEQKGGLGGMLSGLQQTAGQIAEKVKETLQTDVGELAKEAASKTIDAVETLVGKDINKDGTIGGKPIEATAETPEAEVSSEAATAEAQTEESA